MVDWKFLGGITALGGLIGFFGAKTIDTKKLPAGEKAVLTGASTGATMEGLETLMAAESFEAEEWWDKINDEYDTHRGHSLGEKIWGTRDGEELFIFSQIPDYYTGTMYQKYPAHIEKQYRKSFLQSVESNKNNAKKLLMAEIEENIGKGIWTIEPYMEWFSRNKIWFLNKTWWGKTEGVFHKKTLIGSDAFYRKNWKEIQETIDRFPTQRNPHFDKPNESGWVASTTLTDLEKPLDFVLNMGLETLMAAESFGNEGEIFRHKQQIIAKMMRDAPACESCGNLKTYTPTEYNRYTCWPCKDDPSWGAESFSADSISICGVCSVAGHRHCGHTTGCPCCEIRVKKYQNRPICRDCLEPKTHTPQEYEQWTCWPCRDAAGGHGNNCYCYHCMAETDESFAADEVLDINEIVADTNNESKLMDIVDERYQNNRCVGCNFRFNKNHSFWTLPCGLRRVCEKCANDENEKWLGAESFAAEGKIRLGKNQKKLLDEIKWGLSNNDGDYAIVRVKTNKYCDGYPPKTIDSLHEKGLIVYLDSKGNPDIGYPQIDLNPYQIEDCKNIFVKTTDLANKNAESLKRDSCCCGATKSNPCACMIQGVMKCSATCPCSLEKKAESIQFNAWTDPISDRQKWLIKQKGGKHSNDWTRGEANKYIKKLLVAKPKPKPKPKITVKQPKTSFRNPLSIMPTSLVDEVGVMFNKDNNDVIGAVAVSQKATCMLLVGDAQGGVNKNNLEMIDPSISNLWFAWKQEPYITLENDRFIVGVGDIINYNIRPFDIDGCAQYKQINIPPKPTTKDNTYKTIGEIRKLKEDIKLGNWMFNINTLKQAVSKIPAKDTFEAYFNPKGLWMLEGSDWTLYIAGRKI